MKKKNVMSGKDIDLRSKSNEIMDLQEKNLAHLKSEKNQEDQINILEAKVASLVTVNKKLEERVVKYAEVIEGQGTFLEVIIQLIVH